MLTQKTLKSQSRHFDSVQFVAVRVEHDSLGHGMSLLSCLGESCRASL